MHIPEIITGVKLRRRVLAHLRRNYVGKFLPFTAVCEGNRDNSIIITRHGEKSKFEALISTGESPGKIFVFLPDGKPLEIELGEVKH